MTPQETFIENCERAWQRTLLVDAEPATAEQLRFWTEPDIELDSFDPKFRNIIRFDLGEFSGFHFEALSTAEVIDIVASQTTGVAFSPTAVHALISLAVNRVQNQPIQEPQEVELF